MIGWAILPVLVQTFAARVSPSFPLTRLSVTSYFQLTLGMSSCRNTSPAECRCQLVCGAPLALLSALISNVSKCSLALRLAPSLSLSLQIHLYEVVT